jgi:hypothetical protein
MDQINSISLDAVESEAKLFLSNSVARETRSRTINNRFALSKEWEQLMLKVEARIWLDKNAKPV